MIINVNEFNSQAKKQRQQIRFKNPNVCYLQDTSKGKYKKKLIVKVRKIYQQIFT